MLKHSKKTIWGEIVVKYEIIIHNMNNIVTVKTKKSALKTINKHRDDVVGVYVTKGNEMWFITKNDIKRKLENYLL